MAEEVISTIRTAQAFGTQKILAALYDVHIQKSGEVEIKNAVWLGCGMSVFFFSIYSSYALGKFTLPLSIPPACTNVSCIAFSFGTTLILQGHGKIDDYN